MLAPVRTTVPVAPVAPMTRAFAPVRSVATVRVEPPPPKRKLPPLFVKLANGVLRVAGDAAPIIRPAKAPVLRLMVSAVLAVRARVPVEVWSRRLEASQAEAVARSPPTRRTPTLFSLMAPTAVTAVTAAVLLALRVTTPVVGLTAVTVALAATPVPATRMPTASLAASAAETVTVFVPEAPVVTAAATDGVRAPAPKARKPPLTVVRPV